MIEALRPFVGAWEMEASLPGVRGQTVFEWALGGRYLLQRGTAEGPVPDSLSVIAPDGERFVQHYFDERGVVRVYAMTFDGREWTLLRDAPDFSELPFAQRFVGAFSADGDAIDGRWEQDADGSGWKLDFEVRFRRVG